MNNLPDRKLLPLITLLMAFLGIGPLSAQDQPLTLARLVNPGSVFHQQQKEVTFALHGFLEFRTLQELFDHIDTQAGRWQFSTPAERKAFADGLLQRGMESRVISMTYEKPLEVLLTHTSRELAQSVDNIRTPAAPLIYRGKYWQVDAAFYRDVFLRLQQRWKASLNCWSASSSIPARVLSNWYVIEEGIPLFGAVYDSTEHFWQAVKYHPLVRLTDLQDLLSRTRTISWEGWLEALGNDQDLYLVNTYAIEFLRNNLKPERLQWFEKEIERYAGTFSIGAREIQQRQAGSLLFTPFDEKVLWGDLADVFHLIYYFTHIDGGRYATPAVRSLLEALTANHFDAVYLPGYGSGRIGFISPEFQQLMLEIWKVKYLQMERFREVIRSTKGYRLLHFLNDGDSPDIPIPVYVGMLEQIRALALAG